MYLEEPILYIKAFFSYALHEVFKNSSSVHTSFLYTQLIYKRNPNLATNPS